MSNTKTIGVLTSGGDCPGLNAAIRAVVHRAAELEWKVYGIKDGSTGLACRPLAYEELKTEQFDGSILRMSGTILGTINKGDPFAYEMPDGSVKDLTENFSEGARELGLNALVVIGGDGSMQIVGNLCKKAGVKMIGIPKTIDNDTPLTQHSIGFATARDICVDALDRLYATAASHHRVMVLEVMGRDAGFIAIEAAIAGGADVCLVPEINYTHEGIFKTLRKVQERGRSHALVVVAEGVKTHEGKNVSVFKDDDGTQRYGGIGDYFAKSIEKELGISARATVLGHLQRGGTPEPYDRIAAAAFGVHAVDLIAQGKSERMVGMQNHTITDFDLEDVMSIGTKSLDPDNYLVKTARSLGMYVGEE
ncbi:MAG: ATP-dependent 6-phosphofructokinase [Alphaproteobacteria bacterium]|nr:ATP-dependent 6-phosphofructokinase [Alphaproteobacteria bacterium]